MLPLGHRRVRLRIPRRRIVRDARAVLFFLPSFFHLLLLPQVFALCGGERDGRADAALGIDDGVPGRPHARQTNRRLRTKEEIFSGNSRLVGRWPQSGLESVLETLESVRSLESSNAKTAVFAVGSLETHTDPSFPKRPELLWKLSLETEILCWSKNETHILSVGSLGLAPLLHAPTSVSDDDGPRFAREFKKLGFSQSG